MTWRKSPDTDKEPIIWGCRVRLYQETGIEGFDPHPCGGLFAFIFMKNILDETKEISKEIDYGRIGNGVLYDMCKKYPKHTDDSEIIAKVWLIGRAYAASIERNKGRTKKNSDDFYIDIVAPKFKARFDQFLSNVIEINKNKNLITRDNISIVLETHKKIEDFIRKEITFDEKRSFVSKYLHFHFENLFFIYDSRVAGVINSIAKECGYSRKDYIEFLKSPKYDKAYANFFIKCFSLSEYLRNKKTPKSPREIDNYLIKKANYKDREMSVIHT